MGRTNENDINITFQLSLVIKNIDILVKFKKPKRILVICLFQILPELNASFGNTVKTNFVAQAHN